MSQTSRERGNPPPRRKSCAACTKSKRRCDTGMPSCIRCCQRRIPCEYPSRSRGSRLSPPNDQTIQPSLLEAGALSGLMNVSELAVDIDPVLNLGDVDFDITSISPLSLTLDPNDMHLTHQTSFLEPPTTARDFEMLSQIISTRLQWAIDEIKRAPISMILETQTPWCHSQLYADDMPASMRDAHACCALYMAKNPVNGPVILRLIEARVADLQAAPPPSTPLECIAHTQALLLYQIIRLFDGDITSRASAERLLPMLEESALRLLMHVEFHTETPAVAELPFSPIGPLKTFWTNWVFQESLRRTLLIAFFMAQIYRFLSGQKGLQCDGKLGLCHSWTLSAHLWHAKTPVEFARAWRDKEHFVVIDAQFMTVFQQAQADDVDSFGRIFMSSLIGIEGAEGWFASRGGSLNMDDVLQKQTMC